MLVDFSEICSDDPQQTVQRKEPEAISVSGSLADLYSETGLITKHMGLIVHGKDIHFWSFGNFNMMRLVFWVIEQT